MLTIENLSFGYGGVPILNIGQYTLPDGDNLMLLGASGSGKTSLLFLLAGLLQPESGRVVLNGVDLAKMSGVARDSYRGRQIGFIFQNPHLMAPLTVLQNVLIAPLMAGMVPDKGRAQDLLDRLGLGELAGRYPTQLSQGQMQRVGIARALVHRPALVLADEPTSALDDHASEVAVRLLLETAAESGAQVVVATHDRRIKGHFTRVMTLRPSQGNPVGKGGQ